jgi:quercetin dioxygenase-like cupin family protein
MAKLNICAEEDVAPTTAPPSGVAATGGRVARRLSPEGFPLWVEVVDLDPGATLTWGPPRSDQVAYVTSGELEVAGRRCRPGGAIVVESEAAITATATDPTRLVHFGAWATGPPTDGPHGPPGARRDAVHVVGPTGWFSTRPRPEIEATWFADGTCPGCRAACFRVRRQGAGPPRGRPHTHSQDEIIYVLGGAIRLGALTCPAGSALSVPGGLRYAETSGPEGAVFLNFRRDASIQVYHEAGGPCAPRLEAALALGGTEVGDLVTVRPGSDGQLEAPA